MNVEFPNIKGSPTPSRRHAPFRRGPPSLPECCLDGRNNAFRLKVAVGTGMVREDAAERSTARGRRPQNPGSPAESLRPPRPSGAYDEMRGPSGSKSGRPLSEPFS
jgi:hypothetical protein